MLGWSHPSPLAANSIVLTYLEGQASPPTPGYESWDIDDYELHTHPDLIERLLEAADDTDAVPTAVYGVAALAHPCGVIFAVARGMWGIHLRFAEERPPDLVLPRPSDASMGTEWVAVEAWHSDIPSVNYTQRLRALTLSAYEQACQS